MTRAVDLFAGAGGFSLGLEAAGFHVEHAIEVDPWAADTLGSNHPKEMRVWARDIRGIGDDEVKREFAPHPDLMVGGPPCQGFSHANNNSDPKDPRNSLFREFVRFAKLLEPRTVLMENVTGLLRSRTAEGRPVIEIVEEEFRGLGYKVATRVLDASEYGVPQMRKRVFVCGCLDREVVPMPPPSHSGGADPERLSLFEPPCRSLPPPVTLWEALSDLPQVDVGETREPLPYDKGPSNAYQEALRSDSDVVWNHVPMRHSPRMVERFKQIKWGESQAHVTDEHAPRARNSNGETVGKRYDQNNRRMRPDTICHTIPASFYANFVHPYLDRNFTPREGARIQSFPDNYVFRGKPTVVSHKLLAREGRHEELKLCQYNQIGNAVPPMLASALASHICRELGL